MQIVTATAYRSALSARHAALEAAVDAELRRPAPDTLRLAELKRRKLALKDRITGQSPGRD